MLTFTIDELTRNISGQTFAQISLVHDIQSLKKVACDAKTD